MHAYFGVKVTFVALALVFSLAQEASACTRAVYMGEDNMVITGRTMDWAENMHTNLWIFPRGMERNGSAGPKSPKWRSKYGSVVASGYDIGVPDGMNEAGLVTNILYLAESDYGTTEGKPPLSISLWAQYALDNFATVNEAVESLQKEPFRIIAPAMPNGHESQLHLAISDASGDSAIFEYIEGKLTIHHGKEYQVMTNSPIYSQQIALDAYWKSIGGLVFLPGTNRAADRFVRASFLIDAIPKKIDSNYIKSIPEESYVNQAALGVLSVMRSISVPLGITTANQPNISSTIWRSISDQKNKVYFFDSATSPNVFWVPLKEIDFKEGTGVRKLTLTGGKVYSGNVAKKFKPAKPFTFLPAKPEIGNNK